MEALIKRSPLKLTSADKSLQMATEISNLAVQYGLKTKVYNMDTITPEEYQKKSISGRSKNDLHITETHRKSWNLIDIIYNGETVATCQTSIKPGKYNSRTSQLIATIHLNSLSTFAENNDLCYNEDFMKLFKSSYLKVNVQSNRYYSHRISAKQLMGRQVFGSKVDQDNYNRYSHKSLSMSVFTDKTGDKLSMNAITHSLCAIVNIAQSMKTAKSLVNDVTRSERILFTTASIAEMLDVAFGEDDYEIVENTLAFDRDLKTVGRINGDIVVKKNDLVSKYNVEVDFNFETEKYSNLCMVASRSRLKDVPATVLEGNLKAFMIAHNELSSKIDEHDVEGRITVAANKMQEFVSVVIQTANQSQKYIPTDIDFSVSAMPGSYSTATILDVTFTDEITGTVVSENFNGGSYRCSNIEKAQGVTIKTKGDFDEDQFDEDMIEYGKIVKLVFCDYESSSSSLVTGSSSATSVETVSQI